MEAKDVNSDVAGAALVSRRRIGSVLLTFRAAPVALGLARQRGSEALEVVGPEALPVVDGSHGPQGTRRADGAVTETHVVAGDVNMFQGTHSTCRARVVAIPLVWERMSDSTKTQSRTLLTCSTWGM